MARAYGVDLRGRVIEAINEGMSARGAAARFSVGISTAINWHRQGIVNLMDYRRKCAICRHDKSCP